MKETKQYRAIRHPPKSTVNLFSVLSEREQERVELAKMGIKKEKYVFFLVFC